VEWALVTGASSGIGKRCLSRLRQRHISVIGGARRFKTQPVEPSLEIYLDLSQAESIVNFVRKSLALLRRSSGHFKYLVLNAGEVASPTSWRDQSMSQFEKNIKTNFTGHLQLLRLLQQSGELANMSAIVFIGSIYGRLGDANVLSYCAAKAAVEIASNALAKELAPKVRVNCVLPGHIETPMMASAGQAFRSQVIERTPMHRIGRVDEVAEVVEFLLTSGTFITGSSVVVDGGYQLR